MISRRKAKAAVNALKGPTGPLGIPGSAGLRVTRGTVVTVSPLTITIDGGQQAVPAQVWQSVTLEAGQSVTVLIAVNTYTIICDSKLAGG